MFCKNCGKELTSNDKFCDSCGTVNEGYVETSSAPVEDDTFMQTQPFSIDVVAQKVEENNGAAATPDVAPAEAPVMETPVASEPAAPAGEPTIEAPVASVIEQPVVPTAPVMESAPVETKKKSNVGFIILVIVLGLVILGLGAFILFKVLKNDSNKPVVNNPSTPTTPSTPTEPTTPTTPTSTDDSKTYKTSGYVFTIPDGYEKATIQGVDVIGTKNFAFGDVTIDTFNKYSDMIAAKDELIDILKNSSLSESSFIGADEYTYNGTKIFIVSFLYQDVYNDAFYISLPDGNLLCADAAYTSTTYKTDGYTNVVKFVNSAKKDSTSSFSGSTTGYKEKTINFKNSLN